MYTYLCDERNMCIILQSTYNVKYMCGIKSITVSALRLAGQQYTMIYHKMLPR